MESKERNSGGVEVRNTNDPAELEKLFEKINGERVAMLTTQSPNGTLHTRPMGTQEHKKGEDKIWFFTQKSSLKIDEIARYPEVSVSYSDVGKSLYVSVSGEASVVDDEAKKKDLWSPILKAWFPEGLDDPDMTLLCINVTEAEYWDADSSKMIQLFEMARALITGNEANPGDHVHITVNGPGNSRDITES